MKSLEKHFIGIGPQKTGTSWLARTLRRHPDVDIPRVKEIRYFWVNQFLQSPSLGKMLFNKHWHYKGKRSRLQRYAKTHLKDVRRGKFKFSNVRWDLKYFFGGHSDNWYASLFRADMVSGDITPNYSDLSENEIAHVHELVPQAKIIISLRDPVQRDWSRFKMNFIKKGRYEKIEDVPFEDFEKQAARDRDRQLNDYVDTVKRWKKYFGNNVMIFFYEELNEDPESLYKRICDFIGVRAVELPEVKTVHNEGVKMEIPAKHLDLLIQENQYTINESHEFFNNSFTQNWVERYAIKG